MVYWRRRKLVVVFMEENCVTSRGKNWILILLPRSIIMQNQVKTWSQIDTWLVCLLLFLLLLISSALNTCTETLTTIRDGEPRTATSTFPQLLSSASWLAERSIIVSIIIDIVIIHTISYLYGCMGRSTVDSTLGSWKYSPDIKSLFADRLLNLPAFCVFQSCPYFSTRQVSKENALHVE